MGLFPHYKSLVTITTADGQQVAGFIAERFSGGRVEYGVAEASPANHPGRWYRSTRFRVTEVTIEAYLQKSTYDGLLALWKTFHQNRSKKFTVTRKVVGDTDKNEFVLETYTRCSFIEPPQIEDTDVTRDTDFVMVTMRIQPEDKVVTTDEGSAEANASVNLEGFTNP